MKNLVFLCMLGALQGIFLREGGGRERGEKSEREKASGPWSSLGILKLQHA